MLPLCFSQQSTLNMTITIENITFITLAAPLLSTFTPSFQSDKIPLSPPVIIHSSWSKKCDMVLYMTLYDFQSVSRRGRRTITLVFSQLHRTLCLFPGRTLSNWRCSPSIFKKAKFSLHQRKLKAMKGFSAKYKQILGLCKNLILTSLHLSSQLELASHLMQFDEHLRHSFHSFATERHKQWE